VTEVERLASFAVRSSWDELSAEARTALKIRVLDALGCAIGALEAEPIGAIREQTDDFAGRPLCTALGGGRTAPDRAAFLNGALVRYLDFNDSYLALGETCHPSDNLAPVLAAAEYATASGRDLLAALAVAYQVQCRLCDEAPVRDRGFDHTTQGAYAVSAGVSRALGLDVERAANALAIAGASLNALRVTRTTPLSHWKGFAYPATAFAATHAAFLAMRGITGPPAVLEGTKGFVEAIAGHFTIDWERENLERVRRTILKRFNAEIHAQSALEAAVELRQAHALDPAQIERVELEIFDVAFQIIGGGEEGAKKAIATKEDADHSLPYLLAVALLDGRVLPEQFAPERIRQDDVQALLGKVEVRSSAEFSRSFPQAHACRLRIGLHDGIVLAREKHDYEGFHTRPMGQGAAEAKFELLAAPHTDEALRAALMDAVRHLEEIEVAELTGLFAALPGKTVLAPSVSG
jgi:2-methylcitrate dehydratase